MIGSRYCVEALGLPVKSEWRSWFHNHQVRFYLCKFIVYCGYIHIKYFILFLVSLYITVGSTFEFMYSSLFCYVIVVKVGGRITEYEGGLTFVTVRGAGHLVPLNKPEEALALFSSFLNGQELPSRP